MAIAAERDAFDRRQWRAVVDALDGRTDRLSAAELALLAEAVWWLGDAPRSMTVSEQAFQRLSADGDLQAAADRALRLTMDWAIRGDLQVATAWLARARRLLQGLPRCVVHGYLTYLDASFDMDVTGDPSTAAVAAEEVAGYAEEFDDPALGSCAMALRGLAAVRGGDTARGFGELDEAMLPVLAGRVDSLWAGDIYCTVIHLCDELGDLARMRSWTEALGRWSTPLSDTFLYAGVTRVHELQLVAAEGDWTTVERELGARSADLVGAHGWLAGDGYYTLGEVRRLRGDAAGAREAYALARGLRYEAQPGEALLLRADGRPAEALDQLRVALAAGTRLERARMLLAAVELALEQGDASYAEDLAGELEQTAAWFGTPGLRARAAEARAVLLLASGDARAAIELLEVAARTYREQRYRHASGVVHERLAAAHAAAGESARAEAEQATAAAIYAGLGAAPDLARVQRRSRPGGLTEREVEVLRLVATGASNQQVASELTISQKTVSRHLANLFTKIGVSTRTAAAAWARDHGV